MDKLNMKQMLAKTYKIETERLVIRCHQPSDAILLKTSIDESLEYLFNPNKEEIEY